MSMAGSGLEAGAGTQDGDAAESCEQCVHPGWGQHWLCHLILQGVEMSLELPKLLLVSTGQTQMGLVHLSWVVLSILWSVWRAGSGSSAL